MTPRDLSQRAWTALSESTPGRRLLPFAAVAALADVVTLVSAPVDGPTFALGAAVQALAGLIVLAAPWSRVPSWVGTVPALVYLVGVGLVRDAAGGSVAGLGSLVLL